MKTNRGFELHKLKDVVGTEYTLQESSAVVVCTGDEDIEGPFVWLGISRPDINIMYRDAKALGLDLPPKDPHDVGCGWCDFPIPKEALIESRMHLSQEQARDLAKRLLFFADNGYLEEKKNES